MLQLWDSQHLQGEHCMLQAAEQRASDAETDLLRSEEETAALHAELRMLQEQAASQVFIASPFRILHLAIK